MNNFEEEDFQQSGGGWWIKWIGIIVYIAIVVAYAVQTLELVAWLFPADTWFMKTVTVFVCDGCATGYAMAEMFYRFRLRKSKTVVFGMWIVTFVLSTAATVIQMYLSSTHNVPHAIDPTVISIAYGLIIVAFVVNIVAITLVIRMEHGASHPAPRYLDDKPRTRKHHAVAHLSNGDEISVYADTQQEAQRIANAEKAQFEAIRQVTPVTQPVCVADSSPAAGTYNGNPYCQTCLDKIANNLSKPMMTSADFIREFELWQAKQQASPLAQPPLSNQDSQTGQNGKSH